MRRGGQFSASANTLASALEVPTAYLVAESGVFADALLRLSQIDLERQPEVLELLDLLANNPKLAARLLEASKPADKAKPAGRRKA